MTPFAVLVWKEWRGERRSIATLAGAAALLPVMGLLGAREFAGRFGLQHYAYDGGTATIVAQAALLAVALSLGAELLPGESRRGSIALLRRLPCGLLRPYLAKFALLIAVALATALVAWASACAAVRATGGVWFPPLDFGVSLLRGVSDLLLIAAVGALAFMASAWIGRATLALPVALLAVALALTPFWLIHDDGRLLASAPTLVPLLWGAALLAPCVGALSFVVGRRRGGGELRSLAFGAGALALIALPVNGWRATRVAEWCSVDPQAESFRITDAIFGHALAANGRYAYLTVHHAFGDLVWSERRATRPEDWSYASNWGFPSDGPNHALQIDLADGSWREVGQPGDGVFVPQLGGVAQPTPFIALEPFDSSSDAAAERCVLLDANDGTERSREPSRSRLRPFTDRPERRELDRIFQTAFLPDGRRAWFHRGEWVTETADGTLRTLPDSSIGGDRIVLASGVGVWMPRAGGAASDDETVEIYDLARERRYERSTQAPKVIVRAGPWIVAGDSSQSPLQMAPPWKLYDPDRDVATPPPEAVANDTLLWIDDDGAALGGVADGNGRIAQLFRIDPERGTREAIALPAWVDAMGNCFYAMQAVARTRAGTPIVRLLFWTRHGGAIPLCARWDRERRELQFVGDASLSSRPVVGCPDEESLLVIDDERRLVRLRFGSDAREVVFPIPTSEGEASR
ncbi:MAG: hypothetical protein JNL90_16560 [Planctomycetes bacterium]|nr:hypothetical protein [Planctomycetota bacterium]